VTAVEIIGTFDPCSNQQFFALYTAVSTSLRKGKTSEEREGGKNIDCSQANSLFLTS
jgi:hypothetical protein